ncbi:hypothetical protein [Pseudoalteromonas spongiae]|uniref:hypothetical protein n=1 Tax=Pseudoalteromonas spongiae TaxID=298657 RepID=UPI000C2D1C97|nr:hypothetical protein [Pseudoalteromonas spongiae]
MDLEQISQILKDIVYVRPSNNSNWSALFISSYISIAYVFAFVTSVLLAINKSESYSRFIVVRALSAKYILTGFLMMLIQLNAKTDEQIDASQHIYFVYALIDYVILRYIQRVHLLTSKYYNNIYFYAVVGLWVSIVIQLVLWLKVGLFDFEYEFAWYNYTYSIISNLVTVSIIAIIFFDYAQMLFRHVVRKLNASAN